MIFLSLLGEWRRAVDSLGERRLGAANPEQGSRHSDVSLSMTEIRVSWAADIQPSPGEGFAAQ